MIKRQRALGSKVPPNVTVLFLHLPRPFQSGPAQAPPHPDPAPDVSVGHAPSTSSSGARGGGWRLPLARSFWYPGGNERAFDGRGWEDWKLTG